MRTTEASQTPPIMSVLGSIVDIVTDQRKPGARIPMAPNTSAVPAWYPELLDAVADHVQAGRQRAVVAANQELVATYWHVGQEIVARMELEGWGARVVDRLSADLA